jgi:hypothetical protein
MQEKKVQYIDRSLLPAVAKEGKKKKIQAFCLLPLILLLLSPRLPSSSSSSSTTVDHARHIRLVPTPSIPRSQSS